MDTSLDASRRISGEGGAPMALTAAVGQHVVGATGKLLNRLPPCGRVAGEGIDGSIIR